MIFYDFEVFQHDWLVVILDMDAQKEHVIINDPTTLKAFYEAHKDDIWVGYNSRNYDQFILTGKNKKETLLRCKASFDLPICKNLD
jgi:DNA polymerase